MDKNQLFLAFNLIFELIFFLTASATIILFIEFLSYIEFT